MNEAAEALAAKVIVETGGAYLPRPHQSQPAIAAHWLTLVRCWAPPDTLASTLLTAAAIVARKFGEGS